MEKQKDENGKPLTFWGGVNSSNTPEEQLLQEARLEAEKVYPTESYVNYARREGYIQCYIQQAEKRKSEAVRFHLFIKELALNDTDDGKLYSYALALWFDDYEDLYEYFKQQQLKQE